MKKNQSTPQANAKTVEEFSIVELEDRLEMVQRCNGKCQPADG